MGIKTISMTDAEKSKLDIIKKRTRHESFRKLLVFLAELYEQLTVSLNRGEEIEFVEATERKEAVSYLKEKFCKTETPAVKKERETNVKKRRIQL